MLNETKLAGPSEEPPSYSNDEPIPEIVQPATLYAAERFIYSSDPNAPPLYELSHSVGFLSDSDRTVRFERLEHTIKSRAGAPQVTTRNRHLYDLRHPTTGEMMNFEYQGESLSRQSLGSFVIVPFRKHVFGPKGFNVHRAARGSDDRLEARAVLFTATASKAKNVGFEWTDENGQMLAREIIEDDLMKFVVGAELGVKLRDALVAAWILRIWNEMSKRKGLTGMPGECY
ncbi:hypothetical protein NLU13_6857 [Sarocladium strictum]|uniref:Uncharacterized protein n=1 Tax=Sarocladium strictum TaxID=5046 RepID=A0AA39GE68_SARSR|nr:hypothetical protein NLU13_6857 [Sarocladium strictum]